MMSCNATAAAYRPPSGLQLRELLGSCFDGGRGLQELRLSDDVGVTNIHPVRACQREGGREGGREVLGEPYCCV